MPLKDEKLYWHVRVTRDGGRKRKEQVLKLCDKLGFTTIELMDAAVDKFVDFHKNGST